MPCWNISAEYSSVSYAGHATRRTSVMVEKRLSSSVTSWFASHG